MSNRNGFRIRKGKESGRRGGRGLALGLLLAVGGCINESSNPVVFDQVLQSTTFRNRLLTPVILFRNGETLDTLEARTSISYPLGRKGVFRHSWRILAPLGSDNRPAGVEPTVDLNIQYAINADYTIDYESVPNHTLFTPRIANFSTRDLRLTANYRESDEFRSQLVIPINDVISVTHAPYYYWHSDSNILLDDVSGPSTYFYSRDTTDGSRHLRLDDTSSAFRGAGSTLPLTPPF